jgi:hypothetical protein
LALARTSGRALHRVADLLLLTRPLALDAMSRLLRGAARTFLLVRRVRMILGLEVLGLVRSTFAMPCHEFSKFVAARVPPTA